MFIKYVSFQKVQAEHTVLEFRGGSETVKVNYFDVPAVSIEAGTEEEITALIASQSAEIMCAYLTQADFYLLVKETAQMKRALQVINDEFDAKLQLLIAGIPEGERASWTKQESEARAYALDPLAYTPLLDSLAFSRGVDKAYLVGKVIEKADLYSQSVGAIIGERQKSEDRLL
ncbi:MAG: hypothetical protein IBX43_05005 [Campylobacterales bacterium]|nr:hypothetical protein [Campylobacterales bacterium]